MNYSSYIDLFEQGPGVYIPILALSLLITVIAYAAFPLIFAKTKKKGITRKKYNILCYCSNFAVLFVFVCINGGSSGFPYILWTGIFSALGAKILASRGKLLSGATKKSEESPTETTGAVLCPENASDILTDSQKTSTTKTPTVILEDTPKAYYCRKCGAKLAEGGIFCHHCGIKTIKE